MTPFIKAVPTILVLSNVPLTKRAGVMPIQSVATFFSKKEFVVPNYQRCFAWSAENALELFQDIVESIDTKTKHYIGTIVLSESEAGNRYYVVDGQQRLTALSLLLVIVINSIHDEKDRYHYERLYIKKSKSFKFSPQETDRTFFYGMLAGTLSDPASKSQALLLDVYNQLSSLVEDNVDDPVSFIEAIESLEILEFICNSTSDAIRIFQTVNDRGVQLSKMDKVKSLLFFYSNRYLDGELDDRINTSFGKVFTYYDDIKYASTLHCISTISSNNFSEDDILRHHHICFSGSSYDPSSEQVMNDLKATLVQLRKDEDKAKLKEYILCFTRSLKNYAKSFSDVVSRAGTDSKYFRMFSILGVSTVLYPLVVQLERLKLLDKKITRKSITVLDMLEIIDVRVFKIRQYQGKKYIGEIACSLQTNKWTLKDIESWLLWFNSFEINENRFKDYLVNGDYSDQTGLLRLLFIDKCERLNKDSFDIDSLRKIMNSVPTVEHILSQTPRFTPSAFGFSSQNDFDEHLNLIGNLTILEKQINSKIRNSDLPDKLVGYRKSKFRVTTKLANSISINGFMKTNLTSRGKDLVDDFAQTWWDTPQIS